eukprot:3939816-Rhodomonas_salina.1
MSCPALTQRMAASGQSGHARVSHVSLQAARSPTFPLQPLQHHAMMTFGPELACRAQATIPFMTPWVVQAAAGSPGPSNADEHLALERLV